MQLVFALVCTPSHHISSQQHSALSTLSPSGKLTWTAQKNGFFSMCCPSSPRKPKQDGSQHKTTFHKMTGRLPSLSFYTPQKKQRFWTLKKKTITWRKNCKEWFLFSPSLSVLFFSRTCPPCFFPNPIWPEKPNRWLQIEYCKSIGTWYSCISWDFHWHL